jgi:hypothetical protein
MKLRSRADPEPKPAADALAALLAKTAEITGRRAALHAELRRLDDVGRFFISEEPQAKVRREGRELLNGAADGLLPAADLPVGDRIRVLRHDLDVADAALEDAGKLVNRLQREAAHERLRLRADDVRRVMAGICDTVLSLELALQRRDALMSELQPTPESTPGAGWVFLGRVGRSESQAYRFLQAAVVAGWLPEEKLNAAIKQSLGARLEEVAR